MHPPSIRATPWTDRQMDAKISNRQTLNVQVDLKFTPRSTSISRADLNSTSRLTSILRHDCAHDDHHDNDNDDDDSPHRHGGCRRGDLSLYCCTAM